MEFIISIGANIVGEIAKYTFVPIGRQLGYLCNYQRNRNNLSNQIQDLQQKKTSIDDKVRKARTKGKEPTEEVEDWFAEVARQCQAGNEFLRSEDHAKAKCGLFPNLRLRCKLSREAQKMAQTVSSVTVKASDLRNNISKIPSLRCSFNNIEFEDFNSRMRTLGEIMEALKEPAHRMVGVYGAGGIGKTWLVTEAAKMAQKEELFRKVVIVTMSQTFDVGEKQKEIAEKLGLVMPEETESARAERLKDGLRKQEKILIVLDDIWETKVPNLSKDFGIDFKDEQSDCKIVLVSRDQSVLQKFVGLHQNIKLQFLTDLEAMNLFKKFVGGTIHPGLESSAFSLVKECGGLPIAIVTIARTLENSNDICVWNDTLKKMKKFPKEVYGDAYSSIKTSYDSLENDKAKMVLLLCSLHEEDANIRVENLMIIHGAVCNLFHNMDTLEEARDSIHVLVERLKKRCLLLNGDFPDDFKMHDVIRDIVGSIALEDKGMHCFADFLKFERFLKQGVLKESSAISVLKCDFDQLPEELVCPKLQLLLLAPKYTFRNQQSNKKLSDCFEAAKELKALWLGSLVLGSLPPSIRFLQNLQTLSFQHCKLEDIALIGELKNLIVLDLSYSDFELLPEQIGKLNRLRQLNLNRCRRLAVISPNVISSLVQLEELYMDLVDINWGCQVRVYGDQRVNASLIELKNLKRLRDLHLYIHNPTVIPKDGFVCECLERYHIIVGKDPRIWSDISLSYLKDPRSLSDINFSSLSLLIVHGCGNLKQLLPGICGSLMQLQRLVISDCLMMEELISINEQVEGGRSTQILLPKLEYLKLKNLPSLKRFFSRNCMMECESLLKLKIRNCPQLITNCLHTSRRVDEEAQQPLFNDKVAFPRLQVLSVLDCQSLKYLLSCSAATRLSELMRLELTRCDGIEEIIFVTENTIISFPKLQSVELSYLGNLKRISSSNSCIIECPCLEKLKILDCPRLGTSDIGHISRFTLIREEKQQVGEKASLPDAQPLADKKVMLLSTLKQLLQFSDKKSFRNLRQLDISNCHRLLYLFPASTVESLAQLKQLSIRECEVMEVVVVTTTKALGEDQQGLRLNHHHILFPKLESLTLASLPKLISFCEGDLIECPSLVRLHITNCESLRTFLADYAHIQPVLEQEAGGIDLQLTQQPLFNHMVMLPSTLKQLSDQKSFRNLQELHIWYCNTLLYLLHSSTVESLPQLKHLSIGDCEVMEVVVTTTKALGEDQQGLRLNHDHHIFFPKLERLSLEDLPKLKSFCEGDRIECPSLLRLDITDCKSLRTFVADSAFTLTETVVEQEAGGIDLQVTQQPLFNRMGVLVEKMILQHQEEEDHATLTRPTMQLFDDIQISSSITFTNLTSLEVSVCHEMVSLFRASTAKSLVLLKEMNICHCKKMTEVVIGNKNGEAAESSSGIVFSQLETLTLDGLPSLKSFHGGSTNIQFPRLKKVIVSQCPEMEIFSSGSATTPKLNKVITKLGLCDIFWTECATDMEGIWEGDLNGTVREIWEISFGIALKRLFSETNDQNSQSLHLPDFL